MATLRASSSPHTVIDPIRGWVPLRLGDVWRSRDLLLLFAWRDLSARYRQTLLGVGWAVLQPLAMTVVFTIFLGRLAHVPSDGSPYAVFALAGLIPWTFFSNAVSAGSESLVASGGVITKVYFPRLLLPLGTMLAWLPDVFIATAVLLGVMLVYGLTPLWTTLFVPLFAAGALVTAAAVGIALAPLNVGYRDVRYFTVLMLQLWLFASPVAYPLSRVPEGWRWLYALNPMVGVVGGYRWALLGTGDPPWGSIAISGAVAMVALVLSVTYFRRVEHRLADVI
jgi:lipopolysaccharide transport system permease protein